MDFRTRTCTATGTEVCTLKPHNSAAVFLCVQCAMHIGQCALLSPRTAKDIVRDDAYAVIDVRGG